METIRLIKFKPLANKNDFKRAKEIIENGEFWCSKLWNLNDSMEGHYQIIQSDIELMPDMFDEKNNAVICSFSRLNALKNPLLWGYYANGYKGIAIEIECNYQTDTTESGIHEVKYDKQNINYNQGLIEIITNKKQCWVHEKEYRYIKFRSDKEGPYKIGEIKKVHFGFPYQRFENRKEITNNSKTLREYNYWKNELKLICDNFPDIETNIEEMNDISNINRHATRQTNGN